MTFAILLNMISTIVGFTVWTLLIGYEPTTPLDATKQMNMFIFHRSRIEVESQL